MNIEAQREFDVPQLKDSLKQKITEIMHPDRQEDSAYLDDWNELYLGKFNLLFDKKVSEGGNFLINCTRDLDSVAKGFAIILNSRPAENNLEKAA